MSEIRIFLLLFSLFLLFVVVDLVRRKHLREKYSLIWLLVPLVLIVISIWPNLLEQFSKMFGVYYPPSLGFSAGITLLLVISLMLSVVVSHHSDKIVRVIQYQALLEERIRNLEESNNKEVRAPNGKE